MPVASEQQVPKPLTYALMYHVVWAILFGVTGLGLAILFLSIGWPWRRAILPPAGILAFGLVSGIAVLALFTTRVQLMTKSIPQATAFTASQIANWAVLVIAPAFLLLFRFALEPLARSLSGVATWPITATIAASVLQVEVVVWWLSHLLSALQLARARRRAGV